MRSRLHELRCIECRVTWKSWVQRCLHMPAGHTPIPSRRQVERVKVRIGRNYGGQF